VGQERLGIEDESAIKAVGLFGGGIGHSGNTCGALLGAISALSAVYSRGNLDEKENPARWEVSGRLVSRFEELTRAHGSTRCLDIARVDWTDPQAVNEFRSGRKRICAGLVGDVAQALGELLEQEDSGSRRGHDGQ